MATRRLLMWSGNVEAWLKNSGWKCASTSPTGNTKSRDGCCIVMNPAAFTHTSVAILDALNTFEGTVIEVHISNVHKREEFRHHSFVSKRADGVIAGFGTQGYLLGLRRVAKLLDEKKA
jgi:3-dehydroquinate dehydratase